MSRQRRFVNSAQGTGRPEPATADKVYFWFGRHIPKKFNAWAQEQIRSRWFPLRLVPVAVVLALTSLAVDLISRRDLDRLLLTATVPIVAALVGGFLFRGHMRRRALRRYAIPGAD